MTIEVEPIQSYPSQCATNEVSPWKDMITLSRPTTVTVNVDASAVSQWNLVIAFRPSDG